MGAQMLCKHKVEGSIPFGSTGRHIKSCIKQTKSRAPEKTIPVLFGNGSVMSPMYTGNEPM